MRELFRDAAHLFRLAAAFVVTISAFLIVRSFVVPADFGVYGHFRTGAIDDNRVRSPVYAGRELCEACHDDVVEARSGSAHQRIACETCHGPLAAHAEDPAAVEIELPQGERICLVCHRAISGRADWFPAVDPEEHAADEPCTSCHEAHYPDME